MKSAVRHWIGLFVASTALLALVFGDETAIAAGSKKKAPEPAPEKLPWALRDHYNFSVGKGTLRYAVANGEWAVEYQGLGLVIDGATFRITFADGSSWTTSDLGKAETRREAIEDNVGPATRFAVEFPPKDGISVRHHMLVYGERPFIFAKIAVTNNSEKPIEIARIAPAVLGAGSISRLSPETEVGARRFLIRGAYPVFSRDAAPMFMMFNDRTNKWTLSIGLLPSDGLAKPSTDIVPTSGGWQGEVACIYDPPLRLDPGKTIESAPMWLAIGEPQPARIDMYYSWATSVLPPDESDRPAPRSWIALDPGATAADVRKAVQTWAGAGIGYILVPWGWEGKPGSLDGRAPDYPRDIGKLAAELRALGTKPGIALDPLLTSGGDNEFCVDTSDGRRWVNLADEKGRAHAVKRLRDAAGWGYAFYAVQPSDIPDEVLRHFNLTRTQADELAFATLAEAVTDRPVVPTSAMALKADLDNWLQTAATSSRMTEYLVTPGPIRFDVNGVSDLNPELLAALSLFDGPIEFYGDPKAEVARDLGRFLPQTRLRARPLDAATDHPDLWQVPMRAADNAPLGTAVVLFPGARSWSLDDLQRDDETPCRVWRADDGSWGDLAKAPVSGGEKLTVYGVAPECAHPVLRGTSEGLDLLAGGLKQVTWDEEKGLLAGTFDGKGGKEAKAWVDVPQGWSLKSGKAGNETFGKKDTGNVIQFTVAAGGATAFEFEFKRE